MRKAFWNGNASSADRQARLAPSAGHSSTPCWEGMAATTLRAAGLDARAVSSDEHYATVVVGTAP